jgi:hypothetical protein
MRLSFGLDLVHLAHGELLMRQVHLRQQPSLQVVLVRALFVSHGALICAKLIGLYLHCL